MMATVPGQREGHGDIVALGMSLLRVADIAGKW